MTQDGLNQMMATSCLDTMLAYHMLSKGQVTQSLKEMAQMDNLPITVVGTNENTPD